MCADVEQPYCGAPRCERWCQQDAHCERAECSGCDSCAGYVERGVATERPAASPFPAPVEGVAAILAHEASPTCDENFLGGLRAELRSLVGAQTARNNEIRAALGLSTVEAAPPGEPRPPPPPPFPSSCAFNLAISSWNSRSIASFGSSLIFGLFLMFFARLA